MACPYPRLLFKLQDAPRLYPPSREARYCVINLAPQATAPRFSSYSIASPSPGTQRFRALTPTTVPPISNLSIEAKQSDFFPASRSPAPKRSYIVRSNALQISDTRAPARGKVTLIRPSHQAFSSFSAQCRSTMSSDDAYASFLESANADPSAGIQSSSNAFPSFHAAKTVDKGQHVPRALRDVEYYYVSDTDETFQPVVLAWDKAGQGKWPSPDEFKSLIFDPSNASDLETSTLSLAEFDPRNQYETVFHAIRTAISGSEASAAPEAELRVYRIQHGDTRVEYWAVGLDKSENRLVGMKARAVES
ncbi:hypothetical protein D8B26_000217 [Coccidioides posadasii str. Silveira]|uniref:Uncharacterized protein n=1 Tax=Coccidioides posadasii (strain RMSCC 757 / Silveira) TaxID=443226 RepID=E9D802_COCPS|nr:conserved hypothetical protein [Coccidioides posadasii str. Silveira]QVM05510.1 hypothetical protein D8B26_000217 [Coccidioides posadasii str. Silveira]